MFVFSMKLIDSDRGENAFNDFRNPLDSNHCNQNKFTICHSNSIRIMLFQYHIECHV